MSNGKTALVCVVLTACEASPQIQRYTPDELSQCADCRIQLELVAELGSDGDTIWATPFSGAVQAADGRFIVTTTDHPGIQLMYSPAGKLERTFGGEGEGPGEYQSWTAPYRGPGDSLSIIDRMMSRRTVIDSTGAPVRTHRLPARFRHATFLGSRLIVQADVSTPERIGFPLHEVSPADGEIIRSFAKVEPYEEPALDGYRLMSPAGDSGLWVAPPNELTFDLYDLRLNKVRTIRTEADWFVPHRNGLASAYDVPPDPRTIAAWEGDDGLLWVLVRVADAEWAPRENPPGEAPPTVEDGRRSADWILAAIDPGSGEQLAAAQFDSGMLKGHGDDLVYMFIERPAGGASFNAYRPTYRVR